ncbi:MAG: nucleotide exchange factor GrpE [Myxacorys chilensis ATA2-1-KO14]|jgi:molecular chaperone GrpE|nr:nucleotide exchange factor GrpE [Myxacorys chilensis ATA2-1-KO14]
MIEEEKQIDSTQPSPEASGLDEAQATTVETTTESADASAGTQPESTSQETAASVETDDTDYEAAFMELRSNYAAKEREIEALKVQSEDRNSQYMRIAADFENFRRRTQKEKEDLEQQIKCNTVNELLPVVDNFERARSHIKPQTDAEMGIHKSYQGVYKDMVDRLKKIGVAPMRAEGKEFDPNLHEAVMREPTNEYAEGMVVEELVRGYMLGDRVLRHAMVKVAAPTEETSAAEPELDA